MTSSFTTHIRTWAAATLRIRIRIRCCLAALAAFVGAAAFANSNGSPLCTVDPVTMNSNMLPASVSSPNGWFFDVPTTYTPGAATAIGVRNANAGKQFRGILMWLTRPDGTPVGTWTTPIGFKLCNTSLVHESSVAKSQRSFNYIPPSNETTSLTLRAVVVEECGLSSCRSVHPFFTAVILPSVGVLNVDASAITTRYDAATDGVLLLRYLFGYTGAALTDGALGNSPSRDAAQIVAHLNANRTLLDIDGDGQVYTHTDGLLILRYLLGLRDTALTAGANAGILSPTAIAARIALVAP
jgi:hypothetical protein